MNNNHASSKQIDKALFEAAIGIDDAEARGVFLTRACGGDDARLARIVGWLDTRLAAEDFFRVAIIARVEAGGDVVDALKGAPGAQESGKTKAIVPEDGPGSWIDRYRLLEKIGEGGGGVVYLAEQNEPVRRKVALKVIRTGLDTAHVIARFEMERQALALMDHPNIAHVLDAGATESGRPYFVMELVHGLKITEHCDLHRFGLRERLELFIQVCSAIQHAHQKSVIHLDIKPSNILVSSKDGQAVPKVIDFGIARAVEGRLMDSTAFTAHDLFIGTPAYMSPEQAGGGQDLDTRSDGYSLGVLLHELLTGVVPFDGQRLAEVGLFEMLRILREEEVSPPSSMLERLPADVLAQAATARDTYVAHLISTVKGDLDWIVIKATAKDRRERYDTVNGLAVDIRRFLDDEPVSARSPDRLYLLGKLVRRNKILFAASTAVVLAMMAGLAMASWFYMREREARQEQAALREAAEVARANETRLLNQSRARESVSLAAMLLAEGKLEEADALLVKTPLNSIEPSLEAATVFRSLGDWNAIRQRWRQAADCYILYLQANRLDRSSAPPAGLISLIAIGPTLVEAGELAEYRRFCEEAISRYGKTTDAVNAAIFIKACLLISTEETVLGGVRPAATLLAGIFTKDPKPNGFDEYQSAWAAISLGLMEYRSGNFIQALEWNRACLKSSGSNQARSATAHAVSAMAAHRLGQSALARTELALAKEFFAAPFARDTYYLRGQGQGHWQDWAIARILEREATRLIGETGASPR